jgi:hypothetical protein
VLSFPVPGASSEKFVLAIVLLNAFLHGQGQVLPFRRLAVMSAAEGEAAETAGKRTDAALTAGLRLTAVVLRTGAGQPLIPMTRLRNADGEVSRFRSAYSLRSFVAAYPSGSDFHVRG